MKIELGNYKTIISAGIRNDGTGSIIFKKSLKRFDIKQEHIYDIPFELNFKNKASIDTVINSLEYIKELMTDEE